MSSFGWKLYCIFVTDGIVSDDWVKDVDARVQFGLKFGKGRGFIKAGDPLVVVTGWKRGPGFTNTMRIMYVSANIKGALAGTDREIRT
jgi:pyruvate kinase